MVFTIPKAIRGLFERERRLLGLLSRTAYEAVRRSFQALFARKDVRPGCVFSIPTFGSFGATVHRIASLQKLNQIDCTFLMRVAKLGFDR